jgi:hemoglobin-like flavoprotein
MGVTRHPFSSSLPSWANVPIDHAAAARLRASFNALAVDGTRVASIFYAKLFERYPGVRTLFPADIRAQESKLMDTLRIVVEHTQATPELLKTISDLGARHVKYGAKPEHYPIVCDLLIESMADAAGPAWSARLASEWRQALEIVSRLMLDGAAKVESQHKP